MWLDLNFYVAHPLRHRVRPDYSRVTRHFHEKAASCQVHFSVVRHDSFPSTSGRRTVLAFLPITAIADLPYFHAHSLGSSRPGARTSNASAFSGPVNASRRPDAGCRGLAFCQIRGWLIIWHSQICFWDCLEEA